MLEHVVVVTDSLTVDGGSAKVAITSAMALAKRGLQVTVFAASGDASPELASCPNMRIICTGQGDALSSRNRLGGALRGLWNQPARSAMKRLLDTLDPCRTVVHVHGWTKALSSSVVSKAVQSNFPVVVTLHEYFTACPTGCLYLHADRAVCTLAPMSLSCIRKNCDSRSYAFKVYRVVRQAIQRTIGGVPRDVDNYISVSDFSSRILRPLLPSRSQIRRVDNPVDVVKTPRVAAEANNTVVFVGRLSAEKGGILLAKAARIAGVNVVFVGDGPDREAIAAVNPDAQCTGWLDKPGVTAYLRSARCLVVPSLWYETLGLVVLEAAALGVPAIVPRGTAVCDLVDEGRTGLAFERGNADDLASQLHTFADDAFVRNLSNNAYENFWLKPPTMSVHVEGLLTTYSNVISAALDRKTTAA